LLTLRSALAEFLASEAAHHLGIPTQRALSVAFSPDRVKRAQAESAGLVLRVAPTFVRFGSFELFHHRGQAHRVRQLADYLLDFHFPSLASSAPSSSSGSSKRYKLLLGEIALKTARMIAAWQASGFVHGVMNTDNMSVLGLTLDFGPSKLMDRYNPSLVAFHEDKDRRYQFQNQPMVGLWNLNKLALCFSSLIDEEAIVSCLEQYEPTLLMELSRMTRKVRRPSKILAG